MFHCLDFATLERGCRILLNNTTPPALVVLVLDCKQSGLQSLCARDTCGVDAVQVLWDGKAHLQIWGLNLKSSTQSKERWLNTK